MTLSKSVEESLREAESSLRNALAYAARGERPVICTEIAKMIKELENIRSVDSICDMLDSRDPGSKGTYGPMFDDE